MVPSTRYWRISKDYPKLTCSARSAADQSVLNDTWISVPIDVEFKNRTKNTHLDNLLKCEDERYEIDMVMECNRSAIQALEPLAEEIKALTAAGKDSGGGGGGGSASSKWQYRLDKRSLSVIHLKAIARVYADHGKEILELLRRNPAHAIPAVLRRLKAKDTEWRQVLEGLNKSWRETMQKNYFKSLDFRSFQFKRDDPKQLASKALLSDAYVKARTDGVFDTAGGPAAVVHSILTASSVAIGSGATESSSSSSASSSSQQHPALRDTFVFEYPDLELLGDVYHLHMYAVEHASSVSADNKTRAAEMWSLFFRPLFRLPEELIMDTNHTSRPTDEDMQKGLELDEQVGVVPTPGILGTSSSAAAADGEPLLMAPLAIGARCKTNVGTGVVKAYDAARGIYAVALGYATAYVHKSNVKRDRFAVAAAAAAPTAAAAAAAVPAAAAATGARAASAVAAGAAAGGGAGDAGSRERDSLPVPFLGNKHMYLFLHAHHTLYERLAKAKALCQANAHELSGGASDAAAAAGGGGGGSAAADGGGSGSSSATERWRCDYRNVLAACYALLDASIEVSRFEDRLRLILGSDGFELFTLDRLMSLTTKQLNYLSQSAGQQLFDLHREAVAACRARGGHTRAAAEPARPDIVEPYARRYLELMRAEKDAEGFWLHSSGPEDSRQSHASRPRRVHVRCLPSIVGPTDASSSSICTTTTTTTWAAGASLFGASPSAAAAAAAVASIGAAEATAEIAAIAAAAAARVAATAGGGGALPLQATTKLTLTGSKRSASAMTGGGGHADAEASAVDEDKDVDGDDEDEVEDDDDADVDDADEDDDDDDAAAAAATARQLEDDDAENSDAGDADEDDDDDDRDEEDANGGDDDDNNDDDDDNEDAEADDGDRNNGADDGLDEEDEEEDDNGNDDEEDDVMNLEADEDGDPDQPRTKRVKRNPSARGGDTPSDSDASSSATGTTAELQQQQDGGGGGGGGGGGAPAAPAARLTRSSRSRH